MALFTLQKQLLFYTMFEDVYSLHMIVQHNQRGKKQQQAIEDINCHTVHNSGRDLCMSPQQWQRPVHESTTVAETCAWVHNSGRDLCMSPQQWQRPVHESTTVAETCAWVHNSGRDLCMSPQQWQRPVHESTTVAETCAWVHNCGRDLCMSPQQFPSFSSCEFFGLFCMHIYIYIYIFIYLFIYLYIYQIILINCITVEKNVLWYGQKIDHHIHQIPDLLGWRRINNCRAFSNFISK